VILFGTGTGGLQRVPAGGGKPAPVTEPQVGETYYTLPVFLPDGRHFLFRAMFSGETFVSSLDASTRTMVMSGTDSTNIAYSDSHILFLRGLTLMAQPFDERGLRATGDAFPIVEQIQTQSPPGTGNQIGVFAASQNGVVVFQAGGAISLSELARDRALLLLRRRA